MVHISEKPSRSENTTPSLESHYVGHKKSFIHLTRLETESFSVSQSSLSPPFSFHPPHLIFSSSLAVCFSFLQSPAFIFPSCKRMIHLAVQQPHCHLTKPGGDPQGLFRSHTGCSPLCPDCFLPPIRLQLRSALCSRKLLSHCSAAGSTSYMVLVIVFIGASYDGSGRGLEIQLTFLQDVLPDGERREVCGRCRQHSSLWTGL